MTSGQEHVNPLKDLITVNIVLCFVFIALFYVIWPHGHKNEIKVYYLLLTTLLIYVPLWALWRSAVS